MGRLPHGFSWSLLVTTVVFRLLTTAAAADTIRISWNSKKIGPDGPWQALDIAVGETGDGNGALQPMWPSLYWINNVLTTAAGGIYVAPNASEFLNQTGGGGASKDNPAYWDFQGTETNSASPDKQKKLGDVVFDTINPGRRKETAVNATIWALRYWYNMLPMYLPDGTGNYSVEVGTLGLGKPGGTDTYTVDGLDPQTLLGLLKSQGAVSSEGFGLHMGSVALQQSGSCILGGYEQHRALGRAAVFDYDMSAGWPLQRHIEVVDVVLGTQIGSSPFPNGTRDEGSIWSRGFSTTPADTAWEGSQSGRYFASPSFEQPYIYMPTGACEVLATRLPVRFDQTLKLWLWETGAAAERLTSSSAYLGFVLRDRTHTNITIKVPFRLLNLTLEPPLVSRPTAYFPCKSTTPIYGDTSFIFGRAFFQAAFIAADLARDHIYLAQAPGPDTSASRDTDVIRTFDSSIEEDNQPASASPKQRRIKLPTNPIEEFEQSWRSSWVILTDNSTSGLGGGGTSAAPTPDVPVPENSNRISTGAIVGICVGGVVLVIVLGSAVFMIRRRYHMYESGRRAAQQRKLSGTDGEAHLELEGEMMADKFELDTELRAEMDGTWTVVIHEASEGGEVALRYAELAGTTCRETTTTPDSSEDAAGTRVAELQEQEHATATPG